MESAHIAVVALENIDFVQHVRLAFLKSNESRSFEISPERRFAFIRFINGSVREYTWIENQTEVLRYVNCVFDSIEVPETVDLNQPEVYNLVNQIKSKSKPTADRKFIDFELHKAELTAVETRLKNADDRYKKLASDHEKLAADYEKAFQKLCGRGEEINTLKEGMEKMASENEYLSSQNDHFQSHLTNYMAENERMQKKVQALEAAQSEGNIARLTAARIDAEKKLEAVFDLLERFKPKNAK